MSAFVNRAVLVVAAVLLAVPSVAMAADHGPAKSPLDPNLLNSVVTVVVFLCLLGVLYKTAWGPIQKGLKAREDAQFSALDEARKAREEAAQMRSGVEAELAKARDQIRTMLDDARRDAEAMRLREREAGVKDAQAERERAKREIEAAKDAALKEIYQEAVNLATTISAKTLTRQITADDHRRLLDESLTEIAQAAKPLA